MDHEGEAVDPAIAVRIDDARLQPQAGDNLQIVVLEDVVGHLFRRGQNHRVEQARVQHVAGQRGRPVDHHHHAFALQLRDPLLVDSRCDDSLVAQLVGAEGVQFVHRGHDHGCIAHRLAQDEPGPCPHRRRSHQAPYFQGLGSPIEGIVRARRVELESIERGQHLGHAQLQERIGEFEILRVLGHRQGQFVIGPARKEQNLGVVEVVAELHLDMT
jgi:hypothetical protein